MFAFLSIIIFIITVIFNLRIRALSQELKRVSVSHGLLRVDLDRSIPGIEETVSLILEAIGSQDRRISQLAEVVDGVTDHIGLVVLGFTEEDAKKLKDAGLINNISENGVYLATQEVLTTLTNQSEQKEEESL